MKFFSLQQDLLPKLQSVARSVGTRSNLPVLDNILISTDKTRIRLSATNLEIGVIKYLNVEVIEEGEITIPAKTIVELISGLGPSKLELDSKGEILIVTSGKFKATINGIAASEFPVIPLAETPGLSFSRQDFLSSAQILFASAVDEGRPQLTGILTQIKDGVLEFVATDGFRLAHRQVKLDNKKDTFKSLIPKKTFEELLKITSEEDTDQISVSISENQNQAIFTIGNTTVSSRLIEGNFPTWEKIIPTNIITRVVVEKDEFLKSIKLASIFAKNEANILVCKITKEKLVIESSAKELGSQQSEIDTQIEGDELEIAFNAKFLHDAVASSPSTQLLIEFSGSLSAAIIKPVGIEGLEYIVMPVRLS